MNVKPLPTVRTIHPGAPLQCTTYLIDVPDGAILVDPGSGIAEEQVLVEIRRLGRGLEDVTFCLITQCHADHCLGAYRLQGLGT